jgi:hypothetical protein
MPHMAKLVGEEAKTPRVFRLKANAAAPRARSAAEPGSGIAATALSTTSLPPVKLFVAELPV